MRVPTLLVMGCCLCWLTGRGGVHYLPNASFPVEPIMDFSSTNSIALINGQPSTEQVFFAGKRYANLNAWTDVAMGIADRELKQRGLTLKKDAAKSLAMSVDGAKTEDSFSMITSKIVMGVKTSSGYSATYTGQIGVDG